MKADHYIVNVFEKPTYHITPTIKADQVVNNIFSSINDMIGRGQKILEYTPEHSDNNSITKVLGEFKLGRDNLGAELPMLIDRAIEHINIVRNYNSNSDKKNESQIEEIITDLKGLKEQHKEFENIENRFNEAISKEVKNIAFAPEKIKDWKLIIDKRLGEIQQSVFTQIAGNTNQPNIQNTNILKDLQKISYQLFGKDKGSIINGDFAIALENIYQFDINLRKLYHSHPNNSNTSNQLSEVYGVLSDIKSSVDKFKLDLTESKKFLADRVLKGLDDILFEGTLVSESILDLHMDMKLDKHPDFCVQPGLLIQQFQKAGKSYNCHPITVDMKNSLSNVKEGSVINIIGGHGNKGSDFLANIGYDHSRFCTNPNPLEKLYPKDIVKRLDYLGLPKDRAYIFKLQSCYTASPSSDGTKPSYGQGFKNQLLLQGYKQGNEVHGYTESITSYIKMNSERGTEETHKGALRDFKEFIGRASQFREKIEASPKVGDEIKTYKGQRR
ncbi:hypothetical protein [Zobellia galactanivorans]|uniref:Uncharacterized protein n=1 Tax=Zobellia galactanivorans (strain DSM 12802 / CCUG 47099 / CIP 106680 / NCIMB 13871 / Dsij) TaxID=63186 RepID=G0L782_ZOBGA|nr:hypothetical protein [Zobellia galactanivorans]CAZ97213.1 Hypothetical protein ZOBELLIA_3074 [Zobellia galactanivorans]